MKRFLSVALIVTFFSLATSQRAEAQIPQVYRYRAFFWYNLHQTGWFIFDCLSMKGADQLPGPGAGPKVLYNLPEGMVLYDEFGNVIDVDLDPITIIGH